MKGMPESFRGDLAWIHEQEGHRGHPYWPGGASGVTIDPGLDLGHADQALIREVLSGKIPEAAADRLLAVIGIKGPSAGAKARELADITIDRSLVLALLPVIAAPYWRAILARFPGLEQGIPEVHTALLSLAYNRGAGNPGLRPLSTPIACHDWRGVGTLIKAMQQNHPLRGIRLRRQREGDLILKAVS